MPSLHPVLWTKGTLLTPQHLQAQDRYLDELLHVQLGAFTFCPWGLVRLAFDREALAGGTLVVRTATGRFADGLLFDAPAADPAPPPRLLDTVWQQDQRSMLVSLGVPEYRPGARNVAVRDAIGSGAAATARWRAEELLTRDETTGLTERRIQVARANLRLLLEGENAEGYTSLPIARLLRGTSGEIALDPNFVPPLLDVAASPALLGIARRVVERVAARRRRSPVGGGSAIRGSPTSPSPTSPASGCSTRSTPTCRCSVTCRRCAADIHPICGRR